ncbi:MAG: AAA family ATPase [Bacteroidales bacterium]|nr:AAA family ATPase [Candidatus Cacconaster scatequi]
MSSFTKQQFIDKYKVVFPIKDASYAETYRVKDASGKNCFLKLFNYAKLHRTQFDSDGDVLELKISKLLAHPNLTSYKDSGELVINGQKMAFIVYDYISGETVSQKVTREQRCSIYEAKQIVLGVLNGIKYLHSLSEPIIHNELTIDNVMLDMSTDISVPKIIDFGYARFLNQNIQSYKKDGLNPFYMAPESFNGVFSVQTDLYSVGVMLFHLVFGMPPHFIDVSPYKQNRADVEEVILAERNKPLRIPDTGKNIEENLINIISKALANNVDERFKSADEFIKALNGEIQVAPITRKVSEVKEQATKVNKKHGNGFADVAGMDELKAQLQSDVIDLLANPEQAQSLGLHIPNGLLFYGPPGCGKTYFAEKFAEQMGCNYQYVKCSDVASPYIHGGQGKIAAIFDEARKNAPTILFFDEIDAMITDRSKQTNVSESGEVNEFLAQLNNCGHDGVIVIGATNKPTEIDEAALRSGRLELKYYIPQPDFNTRKELFRINLKQRRIDFGIDYDKLASLTENYISADIKLVVDTAARFVFRRHLQVISMSVLEEAISSIKPSISIEMIRKHEAIRDKFERNTNSETVRRKIGY